MKAHLNELPGWALRDGKLHREYKFGGFAEAFGFMSTCALVAQKQDHHPEWSNVFDRVVVDLTTDDAGGITALDFARLRTGSRDGEGGRHCPLRSPVSRELAAFTDRVPARRVHVDGQR